MNYERERCNAEKQAKESLAERDYRMVAYHLYNAARMTLRMAEQSDGRTQQSLIQLAKQYASRGDTARVRADKEPRPEQAEQGNEKEKEQDWVMAERPTTRLEDVAGMGELKELVEQHIILPTRHKEIYAEYKLQPGTGILLYGPPGTGKTYIAQAIAGELDAAFIPVEMRKVLSKWFGESEQQLAALFEAARQHPRTVIFFDEAEALFPKRGDGNSSVMSRIVPQLLQLINGVDPNKNTIVLLGATNRPWLMDEAAMRPGRFGRRIYVGLPDAEARAAMLERAMTNIPTEGLDLAELAARTEGYSGADLAGERDSVCVEAKMTALGRTLADANSEVGGATAPITMADFDAALERVRPSIRQADLEQFERFRAEEDAA